MRSNFLLITRKSTLLEYGVSDEINKNMARVSESESVVIVWKDNYPRMNEKHESKLEISKS